MSPASRTPPVDVPTLTEVLRPSDLPAPPSGEEVSIPDDALERVVAELVAPLRARVAERLPVLLEALMVELRQELQQTLQQTLDDRLDAAVRQAVSTVRPPAR